mgnify:CR=1 FL=1|jgi:hypothetical protein
MTIVVINLDGSRTPYGYSAHSTDITDYYDRLVAESKIKAYEVVS